MRKWSYLFFALSAVTPVAVRLGIQWLADAWEREHGFPPEGKGYFDLVVYGIRIMLVFAVLAIACAAISYLRVAGTRPVLRHVELALFCTPLVLAIALAGRFSFHWMGAVFLLTGIRFGF